LARLPDLPGGPLLSPLPLPSGQVPAQGAHMNWGPFIAIAIAVLEIIRETTDN
jgi:hypothetical protein